jgi:NTP pyrophosphatase (non-canonical NTP hydrolase)
MSSDEERLVLTDPHRRGKVEEELADVVIYCVSLSNALGADLSQTIFRKLALNEKKYPSENYRGVYKKP